MARLTALGCLVLGLSAAVCAQPMPGLCLPDSDGDGHPLFGNPQIRAFPREISQFVDATSVAFADLDGDGDLDAAVTNIAWSFLNNGEFGLTVMLNRGDGVFDPPVEYQAGVEPTHVIAADFSGDGVPDLAVANASGNTVSILVNNGDGTFAADTQFDVGEMPRSLVSADFDGDGNNDIATLNTESEDVSILINDGGGSFAPERRIVVGGVHNRISGITFPEPGPFMACGDLDGDGHADLAVPGFGRIKLLFGDGAGGFTLASQHASVTNGTYAVVMDDLDGDGDNDLATVASAGDFGLSVLLNHGDGTFARAVAYDLRTEPDPGALYEPRSLALGDLEGDGDLDIAVGYASRQRIVVLRNNGDGSFAPHEPYPVHDNPWFVAWADLNGDKALDLAVLATSVRSKLAILLNDGDGGLITQEETPEQFRVRTTFPWFAPTSVQTDDLDGDGDKDLVVSIRTSSQQASVVIMHNDGSGVFDSIVAYPIGPMGGASAEHVAVADLNGDGTLDLAVADAVVPGGWDKEGKVWILMGIGGGNFATPVSFVTNGLVPKFIAIGDLDADQDQDLVVWAAEFPAAINTTPVGRFAIVFLNDGNGLFTETARYSLGSFTWTPIGSVSIADFDGDGDLDLVGTATPRPLLNSLEPPGVVTFFLNDGSGELSVLMQREMVRPVGLALADFDTDGHFDLAVLSPNVTIYNKPCLNILYGLGGGGFSEPVPLIDEHLTSAQIVHNDQDGDGDIDLLVPNGYGTVIVILNRGDGTFDRGVHYGAGNVPVAIAVADFDGDSRLDIVTANNSSHNVTLLRNLGCPTCYADCDKSSGPGVLDMLDFLCFQTAFMNADAYACNCDTSTGPLVCDLFDFLCFQNAFVGGCN